MTLRLTEVSEIIAGKFYLVPCVLVDKHGFEGFKEGQYLPVLLPFHNDIEVDVHTYHYHYDRRFIPTSKSIPSGAVVGRVTGEFDSTIHWRKMKCIDPEAGYSTLTTLLPLESTKSLKMCGLVCPHKGVKLNGIKPIDGFIKCPAHGLKFCAATGEIRLN